MFRLIHWRITQST